MRKTSPLPLYVAVGVGCFGTPLCAGQPSADLGACAAIADEKNRLKCYDEQAVRAGHVVAAPSASTTTPAPAQTSALPRTAAREAAQPEELTARVKAVSKRARGEYRIEMENGQVWVETLRTGGLPPEPGETVTLKRGSLGSFYLARREGVALRVKRVQ